MAQLKGLMDELDIINEKLMQMNGLLNAALEKFEELQPRAAEHRNEAEGEQTCPSCSGCGTYLVGSSLETCPVCEGTGHV